MIPTETKKPEKPEKRRGFIPRKRNPWPEEIEKFLGKRVTVTYALGPNQLTVAGTLVAWEFHSLHCIVRTDTSKVFIRLPLAIDRARTLNDDSKHEYEQGGVQE